LLIIILEGFFFGGVSPRELYFPPVLSGANPVPGSILDGSAMDRTYPAAILKFCIRPFIFFGARLIASHENGV
jgi:hypothetical protein